MFNFSLISILSIILISRNIILLNEETLIFLCFSIFIWLAFINIKSSIQHDLFTQSLKIELMIMDSLNRIISSLNSFINFKNKFKELHLNFNLLKNHFTCIITVITYKLPFYVKQNYSLIFPKKLLFTKRIENQVTKIITLLLIKKLNKVALIKQFYLKHLKIYNFKCFNKISIREYIKIV